MITESVFTSTLIVCSLFSVVLTQAAIPQDASPPIVPKSAEQPDSPHLADVKLTKAEEETMEKYLHVDRSEWVDPGDLFYYDMNKKVVDKNWGLYKKQDSSAGDPQEAECQRSREEIKQRLFQCQDQLKSTQESGSCYTRLSALTIRVAKRLTSRLTEKTTTTSAFNQDDFVKVYSHFAIEDIQMIDKFIERVKGCQNIDEFENTIGKLIEKINILEEEEFTFGQWLLSLNPAIYFSIGLIILIYSIYRMSILTRAIFFIMLLMVAFVAWEWMLLYKTEVVKNQALLSRLGTNPPAGCAYSEDQSTVFRLAVSFWSSEEECRKYYHAVMIDPVYHVNPMMAFSSLVSKASFLPLHIFGQELGKSINNLYSEMPYYLKFVAVPSFPFVVILLIILAMGYSIQLPFFLGKIVKPAQQALPDQRQVSGRAALEAVENSPPRRINHPLFSGDGLFARPAIPKQRDKPKKIAPKNLNDLFMRRTKSASNLFDLR